MDRRRRPVRHRHQPQPHPPDRLPDRGAVVHLRPAARGRLRHRRGRALLLRRAGAHARGRSGGPGTRAHRRGGRGRRDRAPVVGRDPGAQALRYAGPARARRVQGLMDQLFALSVAVPLLVAAALVGVKPLLSGRRRTLDALAILTAASVAAMLLVIMIRTDGGDRVYWFAGFRPFHGIVIGIDFAAGPLSAGLAALAAVLVTAVMIFSWRYFRQVATYYHALMLTFLAGMTGFCLTGDIFDLFVWFELMGVSAYALTAYRPEERGPIQGALNFAITNSVGAYLSLSGIGLIYGRTGALNMAQIGRSLSHHRPDGLVVVAFLLIIMGLLIKSSIVPFHFWLADAHAVAPTPVCVLFSGVMVELGLYGIARVYWSVFGDALGHRAVLSALFLALGTLTALLGALYCFRQRHIKRMLAFSTISHMGLFLMGFALLTPLGLAGAAVYVIGHGLVKAALFLCTGVLLHRLHSVDESVLHGRGRGLRVTGAVFVLAAFGLAGLPPFGTFLGAGWIADSATRAGDPWVTAVVMVSSALVGGTVLRVAGGVFYGLGEPPPPDTRLERGAREETSETRGGGRTVPLTMLVPAVVLLCVSLSLGLIPGLGQVVQHAARQLEDQTGYVAHVLRGAGGAHLARPAAPGSTGISALSLVSALVTVAASVLVALASLYRRRLWSRTGRGRWVEGTVGVRAGFPSGIVNDYVAWLAVGLACVGGVLAVAVR